MNNICKYKSILDLEQKYQNSFTLCKTNKIAILPPVLKKIGHVYHLAFLVIEEPDKSSFEQQIKRPIGLIFINNKNNKETIYDLKEFDFCIRNQDFNYVYYDINNENNFWPNRTKENEEKFRICLDYLQKLISQKTLFKDYSKDIYANYIDKVKTLFPTNYWDFFQTLQEKEIFTLTQSMIEKRKHADKLFLIETEKKKILADKILKIKIYKFKEKLENNICKFCKEEVVPLLKGKGSYSKIKFYDLMGKKIREINKNIEKYTDCYNPLLNENKLKINFEKLNEQISIEIVKIFSKACNNKFAEDVAVDTISKVLIVFLNALLIEERHNQAIQNFEEEIAECISIFDEDNNRIKNTEAKFYLTEIYKNLKKDYYTSEDEELSDVYTGYIKINNYQ